MSRPLSDFERVIWIVEQEIPQNCVMVARVSGNLTAPVLIRSLDMVQQRHPPLRCRIKEGKEPEFVTEGVPRIPLRIIERKDENHWIQEIEKEMMEPFPYTRGPLIRAMQLVSKDRCDLLLTFSHNIADGISGVILVRNILRIAEKLSQGITPKPEPPLPMLPFFTDLFRKDLKFKPGFLDLSGRFMRTFHKPVELQGDRDVSPGKRITRVIQQTFSPDETQKFVGRCKEEKTSVQGVLTAAFLQAVVEQIRKSNDIPQKSPLMIDCLTPVNIRNLFSRPIDEEIGDYISDAVHFQLVHENASIWDVARMTKKSLERELKYRRGIKAIRGIGELLETHKTPAEMVKALEAESPPVFVSNLGRLDISEKYGDLTLEELHAAVTITPACKNGFAVAVTTYRGRMTLNFLYAEPYLSRQKVKIMVESTMRRLKEAIK